MSFPTEFDFAVIRVGDGATPEVFAIMCGIANVTVNQTANTSDKFPFDCAKPGKPSVRTVRVNSTQWDVTGSGVTNADNVASLKAAIGRHKNYEIDALRDDGTDAGEILGTFTGRAVLTASNLNIQRQGDSGSEVTLAGEGDLTWTPAA